MSDAPSADPVRASRAGEPELFAETISGATISRCGSYRYSLWRWWGKRTDAPGLVVIGLNPSTADATTDDPTIRRCVGFAKREGLAGLIMLNLFAVRATDPKVMLAHPEPVGPDNDTMLRSYADESRHVIVAAWGANGGHRGRDREVMALLPGLLCFGRTKDGHPKHPLYLRGDTPLVPFTEHAHV